jgi:F0F1-type ATP synthase assembly protein I
MKLTIEEAIVVFLAGILAGIAIGWLDKQAGRTGTTP